MTKTIALYMSSELRVLTNSVLPPGKHGQLLFDAAVRFLGMGQGPCQTLKTSE